MCVYDVQRERNMYRNINGDPPAILLKNLSHSPEYVFALYALRERDAEKTDTDPAALLLNTHLS